jgi:hypothetical protein
VPFDLIAAKDADGKAAALLEDDTGVIDLERNPLHSPSNGLCNRDGRDQFISDGSD